MRDPSGMSRGSGFVAFSTSDEASRAVSSLISFYFFVISWKENNTMCNAITLISFFSVHLFANVYLHLLE